MCRLLYVKSKKALKIQEHLKKFAYVAQQSHEFQGHGWGCAYLQGDEWQIYKNLQPIWEDDLSQFGETNILIAHVRSAFRDEDIVIENNMPFKKGELIYIFNGELHGVRIKEQGRSGAAKIFNYILRFYTNDIQRAISRAMEIIQKRSRYIRATNLIIADKSRAWVYSFFNQDADYFTMHIKQEDDQTVVCSEPYKDEQDWQRIENQTLKVY